MELGKGEPAPFDGQLLSTKMAAEIAARAETEKARHADRIRALKEESEAQLDGQREVFNVKEAAWREETEAWKTSFYDATSTAREPALWYGLGTITGIIVVLLAAVALGETANLITQKAE